MNTAIEKNGKSTPKKSTAKSPAKEPKPEKPAEKINRDGTVREMIEAKKPDTEIMKWLTKSYAGCGRDAEWIERRSKTKLSAWKSELRKAAESAAKKKNGAKNGGTQIVIGVPTTEAPKKNGKEGK